MPLMPVHSRGKVLIVEPAAVESNVFSYFSGLPLLGPLYLGTMLREAGHDVTVVNEDLLGRRLGITDLDADTLLVSCLTSTVERGYELAAQFKRRNPAGRVIMGGPHVSFMQEEALAFADNVVVGEGENVILDLVRYGSSEREIHGTPVLDMDTLPFIDWSVLAARDRLRVQPVMLSRGCPFACNFCSVTAMFGRGYRTMSEPRVMEELDRLEIPQVFFYDDNFAARKDRTHRIVDGILERAGGKIRWWTAQVRADVTKDVLLLDKMARSGCARVYVGFESINDLALKEMHKGQSADDVRLAIDRFHEHSIRVHGMFVFGSDADDAAVLRDTSDFVRRSRVDSVQYMVLTPFPGTELFRRLEAEGRLLHRMWRYYDAMHVVFQPAGFEPLELQNMALETYADYYNLLRAANDGLESMVATVSRLAGREARGLGTPSPYNMLLKVVGTRIIKRWLSGNADYLEYLRLLPE